MSMNFNLFPSWNMNVGHIKGDQMNSGQMNNNSQSVGGHMNGNQINNGKMNGGQTNGGQLNNSQSVGGRMKGNQINNGQMNSSLTNVGQLNSGQSSGGQMNGGLMINAKDLKIEHSEKTECWDWADDPRFTEVAELLGVWFFHIKTSMNFLALSANTKYGAYLIFKRTEDSEGLDTIQNTSVSVGTKQEKNIVCLKPTTATPPNVGRPKERSDGWLELELGQFYCDNVTADKEAVIIIRETNRLDNKKAGLIVAGIEIHPI